MSGRESSTAARTAARARAGAWARERFADRYFEYRLGGGLEAFRSAALALEEAVRRGVPRAQLRRTMITSAGRALTLALTLAPTTATSEDSP